MSNMWKCHFCKEDVAPNARICPHCGGRFGVGERTQMGMFASMRKAQARKDAGLPKERSGCFGIFVLLAIGLYFLGSAAGIAAEWQAFGKNNAKVSSPDGQLIVHCQSGEGSLRRPGISYFVQTPLEISNPSNGYWGLYVRVKGKLYGGGERVSFNDGMWNMFTELEVLLPRLKSGSEVIFQYSDNKTLSFPLTGSSKALDECFKKKVVPDDHYARSKADIVGLKTGMTFGQFTQKLPDKFKNISPSKGDIEVTLYGKNRGTQATIHFLIEQRFVKTRDLFGNILRQN